MSYQRDEIMERVKQSSADDWYNPFVDTEETGEELVYEDDVRLRLVITNHDKLQQGERHFYLPDDHPAVSTDDLRILFDDHLVKEFKVMSTRKDDPNNFLFLFPRGYSATEYGLPTDRFELSVIFDRILCEGMLTKERFEEKFDIPVGRE